MELNKVMLIGNLTRDPETRFLPNGSQVCKLGLAANRRFTVNGEKREEVLFIDAEAWGRTAELVGQYLRKGSQVLVEGHLKMEQFQTKEGEKRSKFVIVADRVQFGAKAKDGATAPSSSRETGRPAPDQDDDDPGQGLDGQDLPF